jgi:hypothetical protein
VSSNPYLKDQRLQDVVGALQFLAAYKIYKQTPAEWLERLEYKPRSATTWTEIFNEHPEFFRTNDEGQVSLVWRKALESPEGKRPPMSQAQVSTLIGVALDFHSKAHDAIRDSRWWIPVACAVLAFCGGLAGTMLRVFASS